MPVSIRTAKPQDAESVAALAHEFDLYLQSLGERPQPQFLTAERFLRDGFGDDPAFSGLIAELEGRVVGYLLYCRAYDTDFGGRILYILDLFVQEHARRQGVARALMQEAGNICRKLGGHQLLWPVYVPNKLAFAFYEALGAQYIRDLNFMHWRV